MIRGGGKDEERVCVSKDGILVEKYNYKKGQSNTLSNNDALRFGSLICFEHFLGLSSVACDNIK